MCIEAQGVYQAPPWGAGGGQLPRLWTQLGLDVAAPPSPGDTPAHFSTVKSNKKG